MLTWGWNQNYQLGHKDNDPRSVPQEVNALIDKNITQVVCGSRYTLALTDHGNDFNNNGRGRGADGQLGQEGITVGVMPKLVQTLAEIKIRRIATRGSHAIALSDDGLVYTWGRGDDGQLGLGDRKSHNKPQHVDALTERRIFVRDIACGRIHSVCVSADGDVYSWGCGDEGATGLDSTEGVQTPHLVHGIERVIKIACGSRHTMALTEESSLYAWGWGTYGQLGLGDRLNRLTPTIISLPNKVENASFVYGQQDIPQDFKVEQIGCGYRHSLVVLKYDAIRSENQFEPERKELWSWGWNQYGQLGYNSDTSCTLIPKLVEDLPHEVYKVAAGGRHTLAILKRKRDGAKRLYAWGRGDDGQLGTGERVQMSVFPVRVRIAGENIELIAAGWSHSICVCETKYTPTQTKYIGDARKRILRYPSTPFRPYGDGGSKPTIVEMIKASDFLSFGNIDGGMAQLLNTLILFLLMLQLLHFRVGFPEPEIVSRVLPAAAWTVFISNIGFGIYADILTRKTSSKIAPNASFTAIPHGVDTILFFAFTLLIMVPEYQKSGSYVQAYHTCLACSFLLGLFELPCVLLVGIVRNSIPKAALMSALAGISLTFISMAFIVQIFENPAIGILPLVLILVCYGSNVKLPFKLPAALVALLIGAAIAYVFKAVGIGYLVPNESIKDPDIESTRFFYLPTQTLTNVFKTLVEPNTWSYVTSVVLPMMLINIVNNIACVESAIAVGDDYNPRVVLTANGLITMLGSLIGNPFPTTIYIGHPAFKSMGATTGYSYINGFCVLLLGTFDGASFLNRIVPQIAGVGLLMWIGIVVTAQAFDIERSHAVAVAIGLLPALAAWCLQNVEAVIDASSKLLDPTGESPLPWAEIMKTLESNGIRMYGLIALSRGYLLSSIFWSSTLVHIIERQFLSAAMWMLIASFLSFIGAVHSFEVTADGAVSSYGFPAQGPDQYPLQYSMVYLAASLLLVWFEARESENSWYEWLYGLRKDINVLAQDIEVNLHRNSFDEEELQQEPLSNETTPLVNVEEEGPKAYT